MSGISTGVGPFSGINTGDLVNQLLSIEARPRTLAQQRVIQLQAQQAAFLDLNTKLSALKSASSAFNISNIFNSAHASSSNQDVLTATANAGAAVGSYSFLVDRLVSTQSVLSRGFADRTSSAIGLDSVTFEPTAGRLDRDVELASLNGGDGISRGNIRITDRAGGSATVDLSRVASISEVLDAINAASGTQVTATVNGDHLVITDDSGGTGSLTIADAEGSTTATSLGIAGSIAGAAFTGTAVYNLQGTTSVTALNDGNGIRVNRAVGSLTSDFTIVDRAGASHTIDVGNIYSGAAVLTSAAPTTIQGIIDRINSQTGGAVTASISASGDGLTLTDTTGGGGNLTVTDIAGGGAAADLGIAGNVAGATLAGSRILAGLNTTLTRNLLGGSGLSSGAFSITARDGSQLDFTVPTTGTVTDIVNQINTSGAGKIRASLDNTGTGLTLTDISGGSGNLIVAGAAATALGLSTVPAGVAAATVNSARLQHRYIAESTLLSTLNGGRGLGTGTFEIRDSTGRVGVIDVGSDSLTVGDLLKEINSNPVNVTARINDNGDGIILEDNDAQSGNVKIRVRDLTGTVGAGLRIIGEAAGTGVNNKLDGSYERTITFAAGSTLDQIVTKINEAGVGVSASVISDGSPSHPFRLSLASRESGVAGRLTVDTHGVDLGLNTLSEGRDARVFYGSDNPATAVLLSSSTNTVSGIIPGVSINLHTVSRDPVTLSVSRDTDSIETSVSAFIDSFNALVGRIDALSDYDPETNRRGTLLGDSTASQLRTAAFSTIQSRPTGVSGQYQFLSQIGIRLNSTGTLELDSTKFRQALDNDPQAVHDLLAAKVQDPRTPIELSPGVHVENTGPDTFSSLGIAEKMSRMVERYLDPANGILTKRKSTIDDQIQLQNDRIAQMTAKLESRRGVLQAQFQRMEQALAQLQTQQQSLSGIHSL